MTNSQILVRILAVYNFVTKIINASILERRS